MHPLPEGAPTFMTLVALLRPHGPISGLSAARSIADSYAMLAGWLGLTHCGSPMRGAARWLSHANHLAPHSKTPLAF
jgi:hypothetical protein